MALMIRVGTAGPTTAGSLEDSTAAVVVSRLTEVDVCKRVASEMLYFHVQ